MYNIIPVIVIMINKTFFLNNLIKLFLFQGYYMNNDVFGQAGDFITSPEISQVFGEVLRFPRKCIFPFLPQSSCRHKHTFRRFFGFEPYLYENSSIASDFG